MRKHIFRVVSLILCLALSLGVAMQITVNKQSYEMSGWQLTEKDKADVLFFGTSYVHYGILCGELWEQNGIPAYNCGADGQNIDVTYWAIRNALDYVTPKVIVVDIFSTSWSWIEKATVEDFHNTLDWAPWSKTKFELMRTLPKNQRLELMFPFLHYHSRWEELKKNDFVKENHIFGGTSYSGVERQLKQDIVSKNEMGDVKDFMLQAVEDIITYCKNRDIQVVFTVMPGSHTPSQQRALNTVIALGKKYGVETIDLHDFDVVDAKTDFYDMRNMGNDATASHINFSGAKKVTRFLGNWLQENYDLKDRHGESGYENWEEKENLYRQEKTTELAKEGSLSGLLVRLADKDYSTVVMIPAGSHIEKDGQTKALLQNLGLDPDFDRIQTECYLGIADTYRDRTIELWGQGEYTWRDQDGNVLASVGFDGDLQEKKYTNPGIVCNGEDYSLRTYNDVDAQPIAADIQVLALENQSGKVVCSKGYDQLPREWEYRPVAIGQEQEKGIVVDDENAL